MEDLSIKQPPFHLEKGAKGKQVERTRNGIDYSTWEKLHVLFLVESIFGY